VKEINCAVCSELFEPDPENPLDDTCPACVELWGDHWDEYMEEITPTT